MKAKTNFLWPALLVLSLCLSQACGAQVPAQPLPVGQSEKSPTRAMSVELKAIAFAGQVEEAGLKSGKLAAAVGSASKSGGEIRADLDWIVKNGSPAGKLYSAALISRFDKAGGRAAYKALAAQIGDVTVDFVGINERCHYSVSDLVVDQTSSKPLINLIGSVH